MFFPWNVIFPAHATIILKTTSERGRELGYQGYLGRMAYVKNVAQDSTRTTTLEPLPSHPTVPYPLPAASGIMFVMLGHLEYKVLQLQFLGATVFCQMLQKHM